MSEKLVTVAGIKEHLTYYRHLVLKQLEDYGKAGIENSVRHMEGIMKADVISNQLKWVEEYVNEKTTMEELLDGIKRSFQNMLHDLLVFDSWDEHCTDKTRNLMAIYNANAVKEVIQIYSVILDKNDIKVDVVSMLALNI